MRSSAFSSSMASRLGLGGRLGSASAALLGLGSARLAPVAASSGGTMLAIARARDGDADVVVDLELDALVVELR